MLRRESPTEVCATKFLTRRAGGPAFLPTPYARDSNAKPLCLLNSPALQQSLRTKVLQCTSSRSADAFLALVRRSLLLLSRQFHYARIRALAILDTQHCS